MTLWIAAGELRPAPGEGRAVLATIAWAEERVRMAPRPEMVVAGPVGPPVAGFAWSAECFCRVV